MILISHKHNSNCEQIICKDAIFDVSLLKDIHLSAEENYLYFEYDANECGNPLSLPFDVEKVVMGAKLTCNNIHISSLVTLSDEDNRFEDYLNDAGDIEFDVRMSDAEKISLLLFIIINTTSAMKSSNCEHKKNSCVIPKKDISSLDREELINFICDHLGLN